MPTLYLVAGPNGSGKSTFVDGLRMQLDGGIAVVNTDDIARELGDSRLPTIQMRAGRDSLKRIRQLLRQRTSFIHETTLSGSIQIDLAARARRDGWHIDFTFVYVSDWKLSAERVAARVARGGHDVPVADLERRFARSLENFWSMLHVSTEWNLFDNSGERPLAVASGNDDQWVIHDRATFQAIEAYRPA